jgi:hypothetical protein
MPSETQGGKPCTVEVECDDGEATVSQTGTVNVAEVNLPPTS